MKPNIWFYNEGINLQTQKDFECGIDIESERIIFTIRDELGNLVGVKGRTLINDERKYIYLHKTSKSKLLYGLHKTLPYIKEKNEVIVLESEKSVMKLWSAGIKNSVALFNSYVSDIQLEKLLKLNCNYVLCLDKDVEVKHLKKELKKFIMFGKTYLMFDKFDLLGEKDSPADDIEKFNYLYKHKFLYN